MPGGATPSLIYCMLDCQIMLIRAVSLAALLVSPAWGHWERDGTLAEFVDGMLAEHGMEICEDSEKATNVLLMLIHYRNPDRPDTVALDRYDLAHGFIHMLEECYKRK